MKTATAYVVVIIPVERTGATEAAARAGADLGAMSLAHAMGTVHSDAYTAHGASVERAWEELDHDDLTERYTPAASVTT